MKSDHFDIDQTTIEGIPMWRISRKGTMEIVAYIPGDVHDLLNVVRPLELAEYQAKIKALGY